jgi:hypothetical protein
MDIHVLTKVWDAADKIGKPVITGTYFISKQNEGTLAQPFPALFHNIDEHTLRHVHPLPENQVIPVDSAGLGFTLMHKSVIPALRAKFPDESLFAEQEGIGDKFVGEDIVFFRKLKEAGIPLYAHTGALVRHMKRFSLDADYYSLYWSWQTLKKQIEQDKP